MPEFARGNLPADVVIELCDKLAAAFGEAGYADDATELAAIAEKVIRSEWGGRPLYVPVGSLYHAEWLRQQVRARWVGHNTDALCRELRISERYLRKLAAQVRDRGQSELFD